LRIVHIDTGKELRGGQYQVLLLLQALREASISQLLLAHNHSPLFETALKSGFAVQPANLKAVWIESRRSETLVHAHDARSHSQAAIASAAPFVVSRRVAFPVNRSAASRMKYRRAKRYLAVSNHVAEQLILAGVPPEKIDVVYDAVGEIPPLADWHSHAPLVALATVDPQKGRDLAERSAQVARRPVVFSDDLAADLTNASAIIYISRSEGLGSAVLLAMSLGVPVIASAVGGLPEIVIHQETGLLTSNSETAIALSVRRLFAEPELAEHMRRTAHARVIAEFSSARLLERTLACYRRALES
jgi:Glycosyl transferases group 1/Glycosyltransferase Family 4